jgi:HPt (histidine-containing phosphotransfer) domain-containing protein
MNIETAMSDFPVIDSESIENLRSLNPDDGDEFLREIIAIYLEDTPQRIVELEESLAGGDTNRFTRAAHSVKGSSANLGAMAVKHVAELLEQQSNKHGLVEVSELIAMLKVQFGIAQVEYSKLLQPN